MEDGIWHARLLRILFQTYEMVFELPPEAVFPDLFSLGSVGSWLERPLFQIYGRKAFVGISFRFMQMEDERYRLIADDETLT